jgi:hypothetical protein
VKTTSTAARRLLHESNPVPSDAFPNAAHDQEGQAVLAAIRASAPVTAADAPRHPRRSTGHPSIRNWKLAVPAVAMTAALAGLLTVMLTATSGTQPGVANPPADSSFASLVADLTLHPSAHPSDAAAILRQLANTAAKQPAVPLGPVEFSQIKSWGLDLGTVHYGLGYVSHETQDYLLYNAADGSSLGYTLLPAGEHYTPGTIPVQQGGPNAAGKAYFAWHDPAKLPADIGALRQHLISGPPSGFTGGRWVCTTAGPAYETGGGDPAAPGGPYSVNNEPACGRPGPFPDPDTKAIVTNALDLMSNEPLSPAVRASMLRVLADSAARNLPNAHFVGMGTVKDRAGHVGVAIGYEAPGNDPLGATDLQVLVFDPATGALLGNEYASCNGPSTAYPTDANCTPESYDQILQVKAVQKIPAPPKLPPVPPAPGLTTPPPTSTP